MIRLFQNKFFLICLCIALVLMIVPSVLGLMGYQSLAKNIVGTVTFPVRWCVDAISDGFAGWGIYFQSMDALIAQNEELKKENESLQDRLEDAALLEDENERLQSYLGIQNANPSFTMEEGMIVSYSAGNYMTTLTLNRGSLHGVQQYMPVITPDGVVGYVSEVGLSWCMVSTIIETATSVGVYLPRSGAVGMVSGDYSMKTEGVCKITYLKEDADVKIGDRVLTGGSGSGVYPSDLEVGVVTEVTIDEYSRTLVATVQPSVDFSNLKWVMIITGYEEKAS